MLAALVGISILTCQGCLASQLKTQAVPVKTTGVMHVKPEHMKCWEAGFVAPPEGGCGGCSLPEQLSASMEAEVQAAFRGETPPVSHVKAFAMFLSEARSGHTLVGALMDGMKHVVIGNEFNALAHLKKYLQANQGAKEAEARHWLYKKLVHNSRVCARVGRYQESYNYSIPGSWQGRWADGRIEVIGDKRGGTSIDMLLRTGGLKGLNELRKVVGVPLHIIRVGRSLWDNLATKVRCSHRAYRVRSEGAPHLLRAY
mmetsp:Transcript_32421/g.103194  ORF Transcript_32421/g.103194 Transcript_32421/m.103194 type:complete len:257 (+) Transcript_32421:50-820(+)